MYNEQEATKWLEENGIQCLKKKDRAIIHPRHCEIESAKSMLYLKSMCTGCARYIPPTRRTKEKTRVVFGRFNVGKRKDLPRTSSK
jgi:hypothetical protein